MTVSVISRRLRSGASLPSGETAIDAVVVTDNTTGSGLVQIVLPLPPGLVTDQMLTDRKITVLVNGVEQAVFMKAARGRHPAGFLGSAGGESVSMVQGHFTYTIPDTTPITAQFVVNRTRSVSDISETTITDTHLTNRRAMLPSSATYLCSTWLTFWPLLPAAQENAQNDAYFNDTFDARYEDLKNTEVDNGNQGPATYDVPRALYARWCQTADRKYFWNAWRRSRGLLNASLPNNGTGHWSPEINPQSIVTGVTGNGRPNEQHSQRQVSFGVSYRVTGQIAFWNIVCAWNGWTNWYNSSEAATDDLNDNAAISGNYNNRFNLRGRWCTLLGVLIDATKSFGSADGFTGREMNYPVEIPWYLTAYDLHKYNLGDFRDNIRGNADTATVDGTATAGESPTFQWALTTCWFLDYYLNVKADATVAGWIKTNVDAMLNAVTASASGDPGFGQGASYGYTYLLRANSETGTAEDPWTLPMWAAPIKFCEKYHGNNTVNGATYSTWYTRFVDPGQVSTAHLIWSMKIFGESFGYNMVAGYLDQVGIPTGLPSSIRSPTQY